MQTDAESGRTRKANLDVILKELREFRKDSKVNSMREDIDNNIYILPPLLDGKGITRDSVDHFVCLVVLSPRWPLFDN